METNKYSDLWCAIRVIARALSFYILINYTFLRIIETKIRNHISRCYSEVKRVIQKQGQNAKTDNNFSIKINETLFCQGQTSQDWTGLDIQIGGSR